MFNQVKNTAQLLSQQSKIKKTLALIRVEGVSGNQKVKIVYDGEKVISVEINEEMLQPGLKGVLEKSVLEAMKDGQEKVQKKTIEVMTANGGINDLMGILQAGFGTEDSTPNPKL